VKPLTHLRAQARREREGWAPPSAADYSSHARWVFVKNRGPIHPRSEIARMLRAGDRRHGSSDSLKVINYGPVELRLRKLLAQLNWRHWWR
jgi:hypothetical protein